MNFYTEKEIKRIIEKFEDKSLPKEYWTHEAHIIIAFWYNLNYEFEKANQMIKSGIIAYNETVGTPNTTTSGYHETLTIFWMLNTKNFLKEYTSMEQVCNAFLRSEFSAKDYPLKFYSRELLFSTNARMNFVKSDLKNF